MEQSGTRITVAAIGAVLIGTAIIIIAARIGASDRRLPIPGERDTLQVQVLNATGVDGLARAVTIRLRRAGIDVVDFGTAADRSLDTTQIVIRRGDSTAGFAVRDLLGVGQIVVDPDPDLLLDVSVILGLDAVPRS